MCGRASSEPGHDVIVFECNTSPLSKVSTLESSHLKTSVFRTRKCRLRVDGRTPYLEKKSLFSKIPGYVWTGSNIINLKRRDMISCTLFQKPGASMESRHCGQDKRIFFCPIHNASTPCSLQAFGISCIYLLYKFVMADFSLFTQFE